MPKHIGMLDSMIALLNVLMDMELQKIRIEDISESDSLIPQ